MPEISTLSGDFYVGGTVTVDVSGSPTNMGYFKWRFASSLDITSIIGALDTNTTTNTLVLTSAHLGLYMHTIVYSAENVFPPLGVPFGLFSPQITAAPETPPVSNVCFLAGTKVVTDQGIINIEKVSNKNSINGQNVNFVSMTENVDDYMVVLKKDALYKNVPNADTYVTGNHKIFFNRQMIKAKNLVNNTSISKVDMERAVVYNVLLEGEEDGKMIANGMIAETLSPKSPMTEVLMMLNNANLQEKAMMISNFNTGMLHEHNSRKVTSKKM